MLENVLVGEDADGDTISFEYQWTQTTIDGTPDWSTAVTGSVLDSLHITKQDDWYARVRSVAPDGFGDTAVSNSWHSLAYPLRFGLRVPVLSGWNLVSLPYNDQFTEHEFFVDDFGAELTMGDAWAWDAPNQQYAGLEDDKIIDPQIGMWVYADIESEIKTRPLRGLLDAGPITLYQGWNMIGPVRPVEAAYVYQFASGPIWYWDPAESVYVMLDLKEQMQPTRAYWLYYELDDQPLLDLNPPPEADSSE
jgi:hypothetical protein